MDDPSNMLQIPAQPESAGPSHAYDVNGQLENEIPYQRYSEHIEMVNDAGVQEIIGRQDRTGEFVDRDVHARKTAIDKMANLEGWRNHTADVQDINSGASV